MQRIHLLGLALLAACAPANVAGGKTAAATGGTAGGTPVPADAPVTGRTNNPTPTSIGTGPPPRRTPYGVTDRGSGGGHRVRALRPPPGALPYDRRDAKARVPA